MYVRKITIVIFLLFLLSLLLTFPFLIITILEQENKLNNKNNTINLLLKRVETLTRINYTAFPVIISSYKLCKGETDNTPLIDARGKRALPGNFAISRSLEKDKIVTLDQPIVWIHEDGMITTHTVTDRMANPDNKPHIPRLKGYAFDFCISAGQNHFLIKKALMFVPRSNIKK